MNALHPSLILAAGMGCSGTQPWLLENGAILSAAFSAGCSGHATSYAPAIHALAHCCRVWMLNTSNGLCLIRTTGKTSPAYENRCVGHRGSENSSHAVRDMTSGENCSLHRSWLLSAILLSHVFIVRAPFRVLLPDAFLLLIRLWPFASACSALIHKPCPSLPLP
jgi:hypothetical protein